MKIEELLEKIQGELQPTGKYFSIFVEDEKEGMYYCGTPEYDHLLDIFYAVVDILINKYGQGEDIDNVAQEMRIVLEKAIDKSIRDLGR